VSGRQGQRTSDHDVLIIGGGLAGLVAAARAADAGARVGVVSLSPGNLALWSGVVSRDAGPGPGPGLEASPGKGVRGDETAALRFFCDFSRRAGLEFQPRPDEDSGPGRSPLVLLSAAGHPRSCVLAPAIMTRGDLSGWSRGGGRDDGRSGLLVAGFTELTDYPASLIAAAARRETGARTVYRSMSLGSAAGRGLAPRLAYLFDDETWFRGFLDTASRIFARDAASVRAMAFPPVLGHFRFRENVAALEERLGVRVFELSALPPSVPGWRFVRFWRHRLECDGRTRLYTGVRVTAAKIRNGHVLSVSDGLRTHRAGAFVLAAGGVAGGGLEVAPEAFFAAAGAVGGACGPTDPVFGLLTEGEGTRWLSWGIRTDAAGRPRRPGGRVLENVFVAGWHLPAADRGGGGRDRPASRGALETIVTACRAGADAAALAGQAGRDRAAGAGGRRGDGA